MYAGYPLIAAAFFNQSSALYSTGISSVTDVSTGVSRINHTGNESNSVKVAKGYDGPFFMNPMSSGNHHIPRYDYEYSGAGDTEITNRNILGSGFGTLTDIGGSSLVQFNDFDTEDLASTYSGDPRYPNLGVMASAFIYFSGTSPVIGVSTGYTSVTHVGTSIYTHNLSAGSAYQNLLSNPTFFQAYKSGENLVDEGSGSGSGFFKTEHNRGKSSTRITPDYITTIVFESEPQNF